MPYKPESEPVITPSKRRRPELAVALPPSLVEPAPLTLACMACRTARCATATGVVLWHADELDPGYDCAGAGAPGMPLEYAA